MLSEGRAVLVKSYGEPMFANSISLYEPINQYKPIADCLGFVDGPLVHMSYPGLSFIKIPFPTRMTVIQLSNGDSWLHSPIAYQAELANAIEAMGPIRHIVSPNKIHYAHVQEWKAAFPDAITWASPGVRERARSQGIAVHFDRDLSQTAPQQWEVDLLQTMVPGSYLNKVVFFHKASKTLVVADVIQSFELDRIKQPYRFLVWAAGAYHPYGQMPIDLRSTFWPNKRQVCEAVNEVISWKPERIIVSHGRCIESDAEAAIRYAFRWAL